MEQEWSVLSFKTFKSKLLKKTLNHPKAKEEERQSFEKKISEYEEAGKLLVYLDESGFANSMPRTHGYALKGERCYGTHDWGARGALSLNLCVCRSKAIEEMVVGPPRSVIESWSQTTLSGCG